MFCFSLASYMYVYVCFHSLFNDILRDTYKVFNYFLFFYGYFTVYLTISKCFFVFNGCSGIHIMFLNGLLFNLFE